MALIHPEKNQTNNGQILKTSYSMRWPYLVEDSYLVTGNLKHFPKKPFVVTPAEMLQIIHEMKSPKPGLLSEPIVRYGKR